VNSFVKGMSGDRQSWPADFVCQ